MENFLLRIDVEPGYSPDIQTGLHRLVEFRNAIAHGNARVSCLSEFRNQVSDPEVQDVHFAHTGEYFAFEVEFERVAFEVVRRHPEYLMGTYRERKDTG